jgi:hypothetical protein
MRFFHSRQPHGLHISPAFSGLGIAIHDVGDADRRLHYHECMRELGIVVVGSALLTVQGSEYVLGRGSAVALEPGEIHAWGSISRDLELIIIHEPFLADDLVYVAIV